MSAPEDDQPGRKVVRWNEHGARWVLGMRANGEQAELYLSGSNWAMTLKDLGKIRAELGAETGEELGISIYRIGEGGEP